MKKGIRRYHRRCVRCANGDQVFSNEVGGMLAYESYWHMSKRGRMVECRDGLFHEVERLRKDRNWFIEQQMTNLMVIQSLRQQIQEMRGVNA